MVSMMKKQVRLQWENWITGLVVTVVGALLGGILVFVLIHFLDDAENYVPAGTFLAAIVAAFYVGICTVSLTVSHFNLEISMGCTRKQFFVTHFLTALAAGLLHVLLILAICQTERILYPLLYSGLAEMNLWPYVLRFGIPAAIFLATVGLFCGAMLLRFGKKAFWVFWAIWMFVCLGAPRIQEAVEDAPKSLLGTLGRAVGRALGSVPLEIWLLAAGTASVLALVIAFLLLRKQQVTG